MTHNQAVVGQIRKKSRENFGEFGPGLESISPGKGRVGWNSQSFCLAAKTHAQNVQRERLAIMRATNQTRTTALPHPGSGRSLRDDFQKGVAYLREQMHMLMAVKEIGRTAKGIDESAELCRNF